MTSKLLSALVFGVVAILAVACGGGGDESAGSNGTPTPGGVATNEIATETLPSEDVATGESATETPAEDASGGVRLTWWGQAMFVLETSDGTRILMDPYGDIGYRVPDPGEIDADIVTATHDHPDHSNVGLGGGARVLLGLTADGWAEIDERLLDGLRIRSVATFHDGIEGGARGRNAVFIYETAGLRIVHLGDFGQALLTQEQIDAIGEVDVLLIPVGGTFTIDAAAATEVVEQLSPRIIIPMHYKTDALSINLDTVDAFLEGKDVERQAASVQLDASALPEAGSTVVWVLEPAGAD